MPDQIIGVGDKLIFDGGVGQNSKTYMTQVGHELRRNLSSGDTTTTNNIDSAELFPSAPSSNAAVVHRQNTRDTYSVPLDLTGAAIQTAIDSLSSGGTVRIPSGTFVVSSTITVPHNVIIQGAGIDSTILLASGSGLSSAIIQSKNTSVEYEKIVLRDFTINNVGAGVTGGIGINFTRIFHGLIENISIKNCATGILLKAARENSIFNVTINNAMTGMDFSADTSAVKGANENNVFGANLIDVATGFDVEGRNNNFFDCNVQQGSVRSFTRGFRFKNTYGTGNHVFNSYFHNTSLPGTDYAFEMQSSAYDNVIVSPAFGSVSSALLDSSNPQRTVVLGSFKLTNSTAVAPRLFLGDVQIYDDNGKFNVRNPSNSAWNPFNCHSLDLYSIDLEFATKSKGFICKTPDGTKRYRIRVDNSGNPVSELVP